MRIRRNRYGLIEIVRPMEFLIVSSDEIGVPARPRPAEATDERPYLPDRLRRVRRGETAYQQALQKLRGK